LIPAPNSEYVAIGCQKFLQREHVFDALGYMVFKLEAVAASMAAYTKQFLSAASECIQYIEAGRWLSVDCLGVSRWGPGSMDKPPSHNAKYLCFLALRVTIPDVAPLSEEPTVLHQP
jgi:hypothetical protein